MFAAFVTFLGAIDDLAFLILAGSKGGNRLVLIGVEVGIGGIDSLYVLLVQPVDELVVDKIDAFAQGVDVISLGHGITCPLKVVHQRQDLREELVGC